MPKQYKERGESKQEKITLLYQEGFSAKEIAEEVGSSIGSVQTTIYKLKLNKIYERDFCSKCRQPFPQPLKRNK
jgi:DNA-directed RNA polymerase specialized sigma24 family protein